MREYGRLLGQNASGWWQVQLPEGRFWIDDGVPGWCQPGDRVLVAYSPDDQFARVVEC